MADKDEETKLQTTGPTAIAVYDYSEDEGRGFENQTNQDTSLPWMKLLQSGSPEVKEERPGARPGCWINTVSGKIYPRETGFIYLASTTQHKVAKWVPRDQGGGFRGHIEVSSLEFERAQAEAQRTNAKFGKYMDAEGKLSLVDTFYTYGVVCTEDGLPDTFAAIGFKSTMIRAYKAWMTRVGGFFLPGPIDPTTSRRRQIRPPLYAHLTRIAAIATKNKEGDFYVPSISSGDSAGMSASLVDPADERFVMAKGLLQMMESGAAKVDYSKSGGDTDEGDGSTGESPM